MPETVKKRTLLLVDDDPFLRKSIELVLDKEPYQVISCKGGAEAKEILNSNRVDLILSDVRMPQGSGLDLLAFVKEKFPTIPVILMTGVSKVIEMIDAIDYGADQFIPKPIQREHLIQALNGNYGKMRALEETEECRISVNDFASGKELAGDVYLKLFDGKYFKIAYRGENIPLDRIETFKSRGIQHLYMTRKDLIKITDFHCPPEQAFSEADKLSVNRKVGVLRMVADSVIENFAASRGLGEKIDDAKCVIDSMICLLGGEPALINALALLLDHHDATFAHSIQTCLVSVLIAKEVRWTQPRALYTVAAAGLLHDIGLKEIDQAILDKPRSELSFEEQKQYETHTLRSLNILESTRSMPSELLQAAAQHHENCAGTGYPSGLSKNSIHPYARLISLADKFCDSSHSIPISEKYNPAHILTQIITTHGNQFDAEFLNALARIFKVSI